MQITDESINYTSHYSEEHLSNCWTWTEQLVVNLLYNHCLQQESKCFNCANIMKGEVNHRDKSWRAAAGMKESKTSEVAAKATGLQKWPFGYLKDKRYQLMLKHVLMLLLASISEGLNPAALTVLKIKQKPCSACSSLCVFWRCLLPALSFEF